MGGFKSIGKALKKAWKQVKTNLKHGAKYIVPVLVSALTGGWGGTVVKALFGGKIAGALAGAGTKLLGGLFGNSAAANAIANRATDSNAVGSVLGSEATRAAAGQAITDAATQGLTGVLGTAGIPGLGNLGAAQLANNAMAGVYKANVVGNALNSAIAAKDAADIAHNISESKKLVNQNPQLAEVDKLAGETLEKQLYIPKIGGAINRAFGLLPDGSSSGSGSSNSLQSNFALKPYNLADPDKEKGDAPITQIEKDRYNNTDNSLFSTTDNSRKSTEEKIAEGIERFVTEQEEAEKKKNNFKNYGGNL